MPLARGNNNILFFSPKSFEIQKVKLEVMNAKSISGIKSCIVLCMLQTSQLDLPASHQTTLEEGLVHGHCSKAARMLTVPKRKVLKLQP